MRNILRSLYASAFLSVALVLSMMSSVFAAANQIIVAKSGGDFTSIQAAINSITPSASNPYVIKVMPGTYTETVTLKSYISLEGAGREVTQIQSPSLSYAAVLVFNVNSVGIRGFTISNGSMGITLSNATDVTIANNKIINNTCTDSSGCGIYSYTSSPIISGNILSGNSYGIYTDTASPLIAGNSIEGNIRYGIQTATTSAPVIVNNKITNNGWQDMYVASSSTPKISFNIYDTLTGTSGVGQYNVSSNGDPAPAP